MFCLGYNKQKKSHDLLVHFVIYMVTHDVLKPFKLRSSMVRAILKAFKASLVPINHEMHEQFVRFPTDTNWIVSYSVKS